MLNFGNIYSWQEIVILMMPMKTTKTRITMKIATVMMIMLIPIYSNPYQLAQLVEHRVGTTSCSTWSTFNGTPRHYSSYLLIKLRPLSNIRIYDIWDISDILRLIFKLRSPPVIICLIGTYQPNQISRNNLHYHHSYKSFIFLIPYIVVSYTYWLLWQIFVQILNSWVPFTQ